MVVGGNTPKTVDYQQGDTVASVLQRAGVYLTGSQTAALGRRRVQDAAKTPVKAGETIVVAGKPSNG
ncbi:MAG: hypothetical protein Q4B29_00470 [Candidatus Saccharibacteria bacterium]|nr:hypothetical protein [Candidatus Saccharibacteria bacterium]